MHIWKIFLAAFLKSLAGMLSTDLVLSFAFIDVQGILVESNISWLILWVVTFVLFLYPAYFQKDLGA